MISGFCVLRNLPIWGPWEWSVFSSTSFSYSFYIWVYGPVCANLHVWYEAELRIHSFQPGIPFLQLSLLIRLSFTTLNYFEISVENQLILQVQFYSWSSVLPSWPIYLYSTKVIFVLYYQHSPWTWPHTVLGSTLWKSFPCALKIHETTWLPRGHRPSFCSEC